MESIPKTLMLTPLCALEQDDASKLLGYYMSNDYEKMTEDYHDFASTEEEGDLLITSDCFARILVEASIIVETKTGPQRSASMRKILRLEEELVAVAFHRVKKEQISSFEVINDLPKRAIEPPSKIFIAGVPKSGKTSTVLHYLVEHGKSFKKSNCFVWADVDSIQTYIKAGIPENQIFNSLHTTNVDLESFKSDPLVTVDVDLEGLPSHPLLIVDMPVYIESLRLLLLNIRNKDATIIVTANALHSYDPDLITSYFDILVLLSSHGSDRLIDSFNAVTKNINENVSKWFKEQDAHGHSLWSVRDKTKTASKRFDLYKYKIPYMLGSTTTPTFLPE